MCIRDRAQGAERLAGTLAASHFQLAQAAGVAGHGEQCQGRMQGAVGGASGQGLVAKDALFGQRDDGLEQAAEVAVSEAVSYTHLDVYKRQN